MSVPREPGIYETKRLLSQYLLFHYGTAGEVIAEEFGRMLGGAPADFPVRCVECFEREGLAADARALDLGCAVGRASFELARCCGSVLGIDFSEMFIQAARKLKEKGFLGYDRVDEGARSTSCTARAPDGIDRGRVEFERGDATRLPESLGAFDLVLAANLLCRLREPGRLLERLPDLVRAGGQLVITTPCTWLEEFTPRKNWLAGEEKSTLETLQSALGAAFELERVSDLPFLIRDHRRRYEIGFAQASRWRRL